MSTLADMLRDTTDLEPAQSEWLHLLAGDWQLIADLSFADLVLWVRVRGGLAGVCLALALVPGLPFFPFSILAAGLASLGLTRLSSGEPKVTSSGAPVEVEAKVKEKLEAAQKQKSLTDRADPAATTR